MATPPVLALSAVRKEFGDNVVLDSIDLTVNQGDVVALIGASGSGKSTLLRCINLLEQLDDGQMWLSGDDISDPRVNVDSVRARIGVVFQQFNLFPHLSVLRNITLADTEVFGTSKTQAEATAMRLLERVGLADKAKAFPDRLSGGQQQRVALVRAIATNPEVLLLDEITSALDPELVGEVLDLVRTLKDVTRSSFSTRESFASADRPNRSLKLPPKPARKSSCTGSITANNAVLGSEAVVG
jgi:polar amino acid transport system ATP-binding protein